MAIDFHRVRSLQPNRVQRLMLYGVATVWFLVIVASQQRNYQDEWILDGVFWPFVGFVLVFLVVLALEDDNRVVALLCASGVVVVSSIPAFKYVQPYGTAGDSASHYLMIESLATTGHVLADQVYSSIAGMHAWLASLGLLGGLSAAEAISYGLPLTGGLMPLLVYLVCRRVQMPPNLAKYTIGASCLAAYPYFYPTGTGFSLVPFMSLLSVLLVREMYSPNHRVRLVWTLVGLILVCQVVLWHSTTPILLPVVLASASITPVLLRVVDRYGDKVRLATGFLWFALLTAVIFIGYHWVVSERVFEILLSTLQGLLAAERPAAQVVPPRLFEIGLLDQLQVALVIHGRDMLLALLTVLGLAVIWCRRRVWRHQLPLYCFWLLVCATFIALLPAVLTGIGYRRLTWAPIALSPFFVGPALWWLMQGLLPRFLLRWQVEELAWPAVVAMLLGISVLQYFAYQPLVPKAEAITGDAAEEYSLWIHEVNSAYQQRMLSFAETHSEPQSRFAVDHRGQWQFVRYLGLDAGYRRGLYLPLLWRQPVDTNKVDLLLLHWPGPAGGLDEQVEYRSARAIQALRDTPGWGLIYDNGESFILWVH